MDILQELMRVLEDCWNYTQRWDGNGDARGKAWLYRGHDKIDHAREIGGAALLEFRLLWLEVSLQKFEVALVDGTDAAFPVHCLLSDLIHCFTTVGSDRTLLSPGRLVAASVLRLERCYIHRGILLKET